jgi:hypothetical protein
MHCTLADNNEKMTKHTFLARFTVTRVMSGIAFRPNFWIALRLFFSERLSLRESPATPPSNSGMSSSEL